MFSTVFHQDIQDTTIYRIILRLYFVICILFFFTFQEEFASYEANDPFSQTLMVQVDGLLGSFTSLLTEENYKALVGVLVSEVAEQLEKAVFKSSFNRVSFA